MADEFNDPTPDQTEVVRLVANEMLESVNRLIGEGVDPRLIMAGMGSAVTDLVSNVFGLAAVEPWFAMQTKIVRALVTKPH